MVIRPLGSLESPKCCPPSTEKSTPVWLPDRLESFWLTTTLFGSVGLTATHSSDWNRKPQSWLARTLSGKPEAVNAFAHPAVPTVGFGRLGAAEVARCWAAPPSVAA